MTEDDIIRAENLRNIIQEPVFQFALKAARQKALEELASIDPNAKDVIIQAQATIRAIDSLARTIADTIVIGTPQKRNAAA